MKSDTLVLIAAAGLGLFLVAKVAKQIAGSGPSSIVTGANRSTAVPVYDSTTLLAYDTNNAGMTLADQYAAYGAGRTVADVYGNSGYLGVQK